MIKTKTLLVMAVVALVCIGGAIAYNLKVQIDTDVDDVAYTEFADDMATQGLTVEEGIDEIVKQKIEEDEYNKLFFEIQDYIASASLEELRAIKTFISK